jgi:1-acyl-sn-glycerol-3-phosphate acyltransferase
MVPLKPGIQLLIKKARCPVVPAGIAGAFQAWPRTQSYPTFAPMFAPARPGTIAVVLGPAMDGNQFAELSREELLRRLTTGIAAVHDEAEKLRRK